MGRCGSYSSFELCRLSGEGYYSWGNQGPVASPIAIPGPPPPLLPLPGTEILERASGWLSVSTLTCRNALHMGLCRCLQPKRMLVSP